MEKLYDYVILFRNNKENKDEFEVCKQYFNVVTSRVQIKPNKKVICRYSALPLYNELFRDISLLKSNLVTSYSQHQYIANFNYYEDIKDYTFKTFFEGHLLPDDMEFVVKGKTNSKKNRWNTHMYAKDKGTAINIGAELLHDSMIYEQGVIYREFNKDLKILDYSIHGMPMANEWRLFYYKNKCLSSAFYWSNMDDDKINFDPMKIPDDGLLFANKIAKIISKRVSFFVIDVAQKNDGSWIVVEINDGQQSGLSYNDPNVLYSNLVKEIEQEKRNNDFL